METLTTTEELNRFLENNTAVILLFGGAQCGVCQAIKPQLEQAVSARYPQMKQVYLDCQGSAESVCAQQRLFSIPVVQLWFNGQKFDEWVRTFSIGQVINAIERPYSMVFDG